MPRTRPAYPDEFRQEAVAVAARCATSPRVSALPSSRCASGSSRPQTRPPSERALHDAWVDRAHQGDLEGQPRGLRRPAHPRRAAHGARDQGLAQARGAVDARSRDQRPGAEKAGAHDDPGAGGTSGRRSGRARLPTGRPNLLWATDITYLRTWEGWLYLAAVQDAFSRRIVGWSMAEHMRSELVVDALQMAISRRRPKPGLVHHSDQGSQFVSLAFGQVAGEAGVARSMGFKGRLLR